MKTTAVSTYLAVLVSWLSIANLNAQRGMNQPTLTIKQQSIVVIAAFTTKGDLPKLQRALNTGLDAGLTVNVIKEVLVHL